MSLFIISLSKWKQDLNLGIFWLAAGIYFQKYEAPTTYSV